MADNDTKTADNGLSELAYTPSSSGSGPSDQLTIVFQAWRTLLRHKWLIAAVTLAGILLGLTATLLTPPTFRAQLRLEIDPNATSDVDVGDASRREKFNAESDLTPVGLIQARSLAERVARDLNLANDANVVNQELAMPARQLAATGFVADNISVEPIRSSRLIDVYFSANDAEYAAKVANSIGEQFIQSKLDRSFEQTAFAREFLQERLDTTRRTLEDSERALVEFERNRGMVTVQNRQSDGSSVSQSISNVQLSDLAASLADASRRRIEAEQRYRRADALTGGASANEAGAGLTTEISQVKAQIAEMSQTFADDYPELKSLRRRLSTLESELRGSNSGRQSDGVRQITAEYQAALGAEQALRARLDNLRGDVLDERSTSAQFTILSREVDTNRALYDALLQRFKEIGVSGEVTESDISIVDRAEVPTSPVSPNLLVNLALGMIGGFIVAFAGAFAFDLLRDVIHSPSDMEERLGLKALGYIPENEDEGTVTQALNDPKSPLTEAYISVANLLRFATANGLPRRLVVTSTMPGEGKSSSSYGLALSFARQGRSVLLVDADLRRPTFKLPKKSKVTKGFMHMLTGQATLADVVLEGVDGICYVTAGGTPPNPSELFSAGRLEEISHQMIERFDIVIFDAPPVANFVDSPILSSIADGVVMVFEANRVHASQASQSIAKLAKFGAYIVGGLITKYDHRKDNYGYYTYGYKYEYDTRETGLTEIDERTITINNQGADQTAPAHTPAPTPSAES